MQLQGGKCQRGKHWLWEFLLSWFSFANLCLAAVNWGQSSLLWSNLHSRKLFDRVLFVLRASYEKDQLFREKVFATCSQLPKAKETHPRQPITFDIRGCFVQQDNDIPSRGPSEMIALQGGNSGKEGNLETSPKLAQKDALSLSLSLSLSSATKKQSRNV